MSNRPKNFRRRADTDESTADETLSSTTTTTTTKPSSKPTTQSRPKKQPQQAPKLLSFADEEDQDDRPQIKPSSKPHSKPSSRLPKPPPPSTAAPHKITTAKDRLAPSTTASNVQPQAGLYTKEALLELQKNTRTLASSRPQSEPIVVLKGLIKPKPVPGKVSIEPITITESEKLEHQQRVGKDEEKDLIPDQATINAIRAKRERLRLSRGAAPDYISLDGGSNHGEAEGLSDEEPEFRTRIAMFGDKIDKKGVFEEIEEVGVAVLRVEDDEDEEEKIWEEEQFRKGLGKRMDDGSSNVGVAVQPVQPMFLQHAAPPVYGSVAVATPSVGWGLGIGGATGVSQDANVMAAAALEAFQRHKNRVKESLEETKSSYNRAKDNLTDSLLNITTLENALSAADEKFIFMQKLCDFVSVICDFIQHKGPYVDALEAEMEELHEKRASAIYERRTSDNEDEMVEVEAAVNAAMLVFTKGGGGGSEMVRAATIAAQTASASVREEANLPTKLDEFGRDINLQKRMDKTRRSEARQRKKDRFNSKKLSSMEVDNSYQRIEGESSTDESDSENRAYESNLDELRLAADQLFSDAAEEFSKLSIVKERFETWKTHYSRSYTDAYISESVHQIFFPYVKLELLKWDPLNEDTDFNDMEWHTLLFNYGLPENEGDLNPNDADANLVPKLVEDVALDMLHHRIARCWDVLSTRETKNAVSATNLIINYVPASSEGLRDLLAAVHTRLADAVSNLMVPTWSPLVMMAVPKAARVAAYRFGVSVRLIRNICLWKDILALPILEKLALEELLSAKILPHIRSITPNVHDAITRTERVIAALSGVWSGPSMSAESSYKLKPLVDYVLILGKTLEKKHVSGVTDSETNGLARRLKKMLVELNEYDKARTLSRTFHLKEAL